MTTDGTEDLYEDKFERVYAEVRRIDQLRKSDAEADKALAYERTLRLDQRMDSMESSVTTALAAAEKAVAAALSAADKAQAAAALSSKEAIAKAEAAQTKVNEGQNEFRATLRDQAQTFMPRQETENLVRELRGLITVQGTQMTELRSRIDVGPPSLSTLQARSDETIGRRSGALDTRTLTFAILGAMGALVGIIATVIAITGR